MIEGLEDVSAPFVAQGQPAEAGEPGQGSLDYPAVPSQTLEGVDTAPGDPRLDGAPQRWSAVHKIIALVGTELGGPSAEPPPTLAHWRHGIDQLVKEAAVMDICRGHPEGERNTPGISDEVALGPGSAAAHPFERARWRCPRKRGTNRRFENSLQIIGDNRLGHADHYSPPRLPFQCATVRHRLLEVVVEEFVGIACGGIEPAPAKAGGGRSKSSM